MRVRPLPQMMRSLGCAAVQVNELASGFRGRCCCLRPILIPYALKVDARTRLIAWRCYLYLSVLARRDALFAQLKQNIAIDTNRDGAILTSRNGQNSGLHCCAANRTKL